MVAPWKVTLQCRWIVTMSSVRPMGSRGGGDKDEEREEKGGGWMVKRGRRGSMLSIP